jgi:hypothetical protein
MSNDRIVYSYGMTMELQQFNNAKFQVTYETDVKEGESPKEAFARAKKFVDSKVEGEILEIQDLREK